MTVVAHGSHGVRTGASALPAHGWNAASSVIEMDWFTPHAIEYRSRKSACLPAKYGNWRGVYNRLRTCAVDGTWERVLTELVVDELPAPDPAGAPSRAHAPAVQGAMTTESVAWRHSARAGCPHGA